MLALDNDYIDRLNRNYDAGRFLKAIVVTESLDPLVKRHWVDHERPLVFGGATYEPLAMKWGPLKTSSDLSQEAQTVHVSNLGYRANDYVEELDITGNPAVLQVLHLEMAEAGTLTNFFQRTYVVRGVLGDARQAQFTLVKKRGGGDLPRGVMLKKEFPAMVDGAVRIF